MTTSVLTEMNGGHRATEFYYVPYATENLQFIRQVEVENNITRAATLHGNPLSRHPLFLVIKREGYAG